MSPPFTPPIREVRTARRPYFKDADGRRVPGVTSLLNGVPKPKLMNWHGDATAEYAVDHWDELAAMSPSARLKALRKGRYANRDVAAKRGDEVHKLAARLVAGESVAVPEDIAGYVESCVQFFDDWEPEPVLIETLTINYARGYVAILDAVYEFPHLGRVLVDIKTTRSGIFGETALQLAGARFAEVFVDGEGDEHPMLQVDFCAGLHITESGYELKPITVEERQYRQLLYAGEMRQFVEEESDDLVGSALTPPSRAPRRRLELAAEDVEVAS